MKQQWSTFEKSWLVTFTLITLYLHFAWQGSLISLIAALSGMACVVLVARGKIANYYYGIVQVVLYGLIAYEYRLYGEVMLNWLYYLPIQVAALYLWNQNRTTQPVLYEDVVVKKLSAHQWLAVLVMIVCTTYAYHLVLQYIGGGNTLLDSATTTLQIVAMLLMMWRYVEQWVLWIVVNVLSIALWSIALSNGDGNDYNILIMWIAYLINSVYGLRSWLLMQRKAV